jgi:hypothetical protein
MRGEFAIVLLPLGEGLWAHQAGNSDHSAPVIEDSSHYSFCKRWRLNIALQYLRYGTEDHKPMTLLQFFVLAFSCGQVLPEEHVSRRYSDEVYNANVSLAELGVSKIHIYEGMPDYFVYVPEKKLVLQRGHDGQHHPETIIGVRGTKSNWRGLMFTSQLGFKNSPNREEPDRGNYEFTGTYGRAICAIGTGGYQKKEVLATGVVDGRKVWTVLDHDARSFPANKSGGLPNFEIKFSFPDGYRLSEVESLSLHGDAAELLAWVRTGSSRPRLSFWRGSLGSEDKFRVRVLRAKELVFVAGAHSEYYPYRGDHRRFDLVGRRYQIGKRTFAYVGKTGNTQTFPIPRAAAYEYFSLRGKWCRFLRDNRRIKNVFKDPSGRLEVLKNGRWCNAGPLYPIGTSFAHSYIMFYDVERGELTVGEML